MTPNHISQQIIIAKVIPFKGSNVSFSKSFQKTNTPMVKVRNKEIITLHLPSCASSLSHHTMLNLRPTPHTGRNNPLFTTTEKEVTKFQKGHQRSLILIFTSNRWAKFYLAWQDPLTTAFLMCCG